MNGAYSRVAWFYNAWSRLTESKSSKKVMEFAAIQGGERILEVAVGTGLTFAEIVRFNSKGLNYGIDISESMLAKAKQLMKGFPEECYHLQIGNARRLPFDANTFDLVVNNFMLDLLPEEEFEAVLGEFGRVLRPGGRMVLSTMTFGRKWYNGIWQWIAEHFPSLLTGCRPVFVDHYLEQSGFEIVQSAYVSQNTFPSQVLKARKRDMPYQRVAP